MLTPSCLDEDMPWALRELVCAYANGHHELQQPSHAQGQCTNASSRFMKLLLECEIADDWEEVDWEFEIERWGHDEADWGWVIVSGPDVPSHIDPIFSADSPAMQKYRGHTAVFVKCEDSSWIIDFTARQFDPNSPWPLIWRAA